MDKEDKKIDPYTDPYDKDGAQWEEEMQETLDNYSSIVTIVFFILFIAVCITLITFKCR